MTSIRKLFARDIKISSKKNCTTHSCSIQGLQVVSIFQSYLKETSMWFVFVGFICFIQDRVHGIYSLFVSSVRGLEFTFPLMGITSEHHNWPFEPGIFGLVILDLFLCMEKRIDIKVWESKERTKEDGSFSGLKGD